MADFQEETVLLKYLDFHIPYMSRCIGPVFMRGACKKCRNHHIYAVSSGNGLTDMIDQEPPIYYTLLAAF